MGPYPVGRILTIYKRQSLNANEFESRDYSMYLIMVYSKLLVKISHLIVRSCIVFINIELYSNLLTNLAAPVAFMSLLMILCWLITMRLLFRCWNNFYVLASLILVHILLLIGHLSTFIAFRSTGHLWCCVHDPLCWASWLLVWDKNLWRGCSTAGLMVLGFE
jgi:hypothetical protein